jgi:hypothetical protein
MLAALTLVSISAKYADVDLHTGKSAPTNYQSQNVALAGNNMIEYQVMVGGKVLKTGISFLELLNKIGPPNKIDYDKTGYAPTYYIGGYYLSFVFRSDRLVYIVAVTD